MYDYGEVMVMFPIYAIVKIERRYLFLSEGVMNKRKDPPRLEVEARKTICNMIREVGVRWTGKLRSAVAMGRHRWLREIESVEEECVQLRWTLAALPVPSMLDVIVADSVSEFINIIYSFDIEVGSHRLITTNKNFHQDICANMFKAVLFPCLYKYKINNALTGFVQEVVITLLYVNPDVSALHMPSVYNRKHLQLLLQRIPILTALKEFCFHIGCTTQIVVELSKYCTHLNKLSLEDCRFVDDDCVSHILKMKHLVTLNVANTSISDEGYVTILSRLPNLQNVVWYNNLDVVLTYIRDHLLPVRKVVGRISKARLLVQKCPNVEHLILLSIREDISDIKELSRVTAVSVVQSSCITINLGAVNRNIGSTLKKLDLYQVVNINIDDLILYCTVIKTLTIAYSHIIGPDHNSFDSELPHFKSVEEIRLRQNWGTHDFCYLLHLYANLKVCYTAGVNPVDDKFIRQVLTHGGFRRVTEFVIEYCGELTLPTVWLLMRSCPNLTVLGNVSSWSRVSSNDLVVIREHLRVNNLALIINL